MAKILEGGRNGESLRIGVAVARFNRYITARMLDACLSRLEELGVSESDITVAWTPGSFELPGVAMRMAQSSSFDAVICLGTVIEGETAHFEHVCRAAADGVSRVAADTGKPVIFGVLTTYTTDQAFARIGHAGGYAEAAVEMARLMRSLDDAAR